MRFVSPRLIENTLLREAIHSKAISPSGSAEMSGIAKLGESTRIKSLAKFAVLGDIGHPSYPSHPTEEHSSTSS
jgi:hypothetical protein